MELSRDRLAAAVVARCRNECIEPPAPGRLRRLVGKAVKDFESQFCRSRADPGAPGLESPLAEVNKLERVRRLELPADLFAERNHSSK